MRICRICSTTVYFTDDSDGCGLNATYEFLSFVKHLSRGRKYKKCLEWCSGPGYFGFGALDKQNNLIENLVLSDIYEPNKILVEHTIEVNDLKDRARFYLSDNFKSIPKTEKFDLIIGNPPHFNFDPYAQYYTDPRKYKDTDWKIHEDFFNNVNDYLTNDGQIILLESVWGSGLKTFDEMLKRNNLILNRHSLSKAFPNDFWFLEIIKK